MKIELLAAVLLTSSASLSFSQSDTSRMQKTKMSGTYEQTDTSRIRYEAPVDKTGQDTSSMRRNGTNNTREYRSNVPDTSVKRSGDAQQHNKTKTENDRSKSRTYDANDRNYQKESGTENKKYIKGSSDTTRNMYLIRKDSLNKGK